MYLFPFLSFLEFDSEFCSLPEFSISLLSDLFDFSSLTLWGILLGLGLVGCLRQNIKHWTYTFTWLHSANLDTRSSRNYSVCMVPTLFLLIINRTCSWSFRGQLWRSEDFYLALAYDVCLWTSNLAEKLRYFHLNHNSNKILKSDWLSTVRISPLTRQCNRTVCIMPK